MAVDGEALKREAMALTQRLVLSEQHGIRLASGMDAMKGEMEAAMGQARKQIADLENRGGGGRGGYEDRMDLIDIKSMQPQIFSGEVQESYKQAAKKIKAFCNARRPGFRQALDWAEAEVTRHVDGDELGACRNS